MPESVAIAPEVPSFEAQLRLRLEHNPADVGAMAKLGRLLRKRGSLEEARTVLESAAALQPRNQDLLEELGFLLVRMGDLVAAHLWMSRLRDADRLPRLDQLRGWMRKHVKPWIRQARAQEQAGRLEEALAAYRTAIALEPEVLARRLELAGFLISIGRYEGAQAYLEDVPDEPEVLALRQEAAALRALNPYRRSDAYAGKLHQQAVVELKSGRAAIAEPMLRELTLAYPDFVQAWADLRAARLVLGRTAEAEAVAALWAAASPSTTRYIDMVLARPVSARGLIFDRNDRFPLVSKTTLRQVRTPDELKQASDACLVIDPGGERVDTHPFLHVDEEPPPAVPVTSGETFVLALDNAMVTGRGAVITQKGEIIAEQFFLEKADKYRAQVGSGRVVFGDAFGEEPVKVGYWDRPAFFCMGPTDRGYGDWLNQFPPRLLLAEAVGLDCDVLINRDSLPQFIQMLEAVGLPRSRMVYQKVPRAMVYRRLYVPSWPYGQKNWPMKDWLKIYKRAARPPASSERPLLYLSRRNIANRPLVNEDEIRELFLGRGFTEVTPEQLSFAQMLEVFSNPACVAGPWGSAFQSLAFCHTPPIAFTLIPRYNEKYMRSVGTYMHHAGVRLGYVFGERVQFKHGPNADPWTISRDKAARALDRVLELVAREAG
jgi:capsular polysaccharide biosynthesis protein/tetratricopeptide (TPR) repeat protein